MSDRFDRGMSMFIPSNYSNIKVGIIGAWWIGSNSTYVLSKMGIHCKVADFDVVEEVNTWSQFYSLEQVWMPKVEALKQNIKKMADEDIEIINWKYNADDFKDCQVLILALDSIDTRKQVIESCADTQFILDTRMVKKLSIVNTLYWIQRDDWIKKEWHEWIDNEDDNTLCSEKAIWFNAMAMAWLVWSLVVDYLNGEQLDYAYNLDLEWYRLYRFKS